MLKLQNINALPEVLTIKHRPSPDRQGAGSETNVESPVADARGSDIPKLPAAPGSTYHAPDGLGAYLITFTTYGTWLPGDERSFVDCEHNRPDEPRLAPDPERRRAAEQRLKHSPLVFDLPQRQYVLEAILEVCRHRRWWAHCSCADPTMCMSWFRLQ